MDSRIDQRFSAVDQRFTAIDGQLATLRGEMSGQFRWIVGIQVTVFVALAGTLISGFFALQ